MELLKILRMELSYDPVVLMLGVYPKNMKTLIQKDICTPMFIAALSIMSQVMEAT